MEVRGQLQVSLPSTLFETGSSPLGTPGWLACEMVGILSPPTFYLPKGVLGLETCALSLPHCALPSPKESSPSSGGIFVLVF